MSARQQLQESLQQLGTVCGDDGWHMPTRAEQRRQKQAEKRRRKRDARQRKRQGCRS